MEQFNQVQAQRVWQRVRGEGCAAPEPDLAALIRAEWEDAAIYLQLSKKFTGSEGALLHRMFEQEQSHCACLRGIYAVTAGKPLPLSPAAPIHGSVQQILRQCYGREMRAMSAYDSRSDDPQYGHVFARLRDQEQEHCRMILQLIGSVMRK